MKQIIPVTLPDKLFYLLDNMTGRFSALIKQSPLTICDLETIDDDHTLVYNDASMATIIELHGSTKLVGAIEYEELVESLYSSLSGQLADGGHEIVSYFSRDPERIKYVLEDHMRSSRISTDKIDFNIKDIQDEKVSVLSKFCQVETSYLILFTNLQKLSKPELKIALNKRLKNLKKSPLAKESTNVSWVIDDLRSKHTTFVENIKNEFLDCGISTSILNVHEAVKAMRMSVDPEWTADDWKALLPGDPIPFRASEDMFSDASGILWPRIEEQIIPRMINDEEGDIIKIGSRLIAPITVGIGPEKPEPFQILFKRLNSENMAWRISFKFTLDDSLIHGIKFHLATMLSVTPGTMNNKWLLNAQEQMIALRESGVPTAKLQISAATWINHDDLELIRKNKEILARHIQGWGNSEVQSSEGDPTETFISSGPGISRGSVATPMCPPLEDLIKMLPVTRPASPFKHGTCLYSTLDGKIIPYQPMSSLQTSWVTLYSGGMGYGKSVALNDNHLSLMQNPDLVDIPFISIVDFNATSKGFIDLCLSSLPDNKKHYAFSAKIKNTKDFAYNMFDTLLGSRYPLSSHRTQLINFLCYLATPVGSQYPQDGIQGMADACITLAYKRCDERKTAKMYVRGLNQSIDKVITELGYQINEKMTQWWDIVDVLFRAGLTKEASIAQRYAVPTLPEIASIAKSNEIRSMYKGYSQSKEILPDYFWRVITEAINIYPVIAYQTQFEIGEARLISIDLTDVCDSNASDGSKQTGIMGMYAFRLLTAKYFLDFEHLKELPKTVGQYNVSYIDYHHKFITLLKKVPKRFAVDELHRFGSTTNFEDQLLSIIREARKAEIELLLSSQLPTDFPKKIITLATSKFIMGGSKRYAELARDTFKLSRTLYYHLVNNIRKPNKTGAKFIAQIETDKGEFNQLCTNILGPTTLWGLTNGSSDVYIRDTLYGKMPPDEARKLLGKYYPGGTVKNHLEQMISKRISASRNDLMQHDDKYKDNAGNEDDNDLLDEIIKNLLTKYNIENLSGSALC